MISPKARPVMSDHFGTPDKPFLYQSYLLATLVHQTSLSCTNPISWPLWYTRQAPPVPILSPGHFGTPDKHLLYQSYLLATLVHQTSTSCTNLISWSLWYTRQASPVPIISPGDFGTESLLLIQHRKEMAAESLLLATISYSEIRNYLVIFMLPT